MGWKYALNGVNIVVVYNHDRTKHCVLEYDFEQKGFNYRSDYLITKHFVYNGRRYNRDNIRNFAIYHRLLDEIGHARFAEIAREIDPN